MVEHYADGDVFDGSLEPGLGADVGRAGSPSGVRRRRADFTRRATTPRRRRAAIKALRDEGNEIDLAALRGLLKAMRS